ncbi:MAG: helix-turn-helix domain-containing protein [Acidimicrobiaceae bacterium]|nr:nucleotidyltransferase domain-containing protein [Acidimicrobiaceae bacterium]MXW75876.1 helix-turn-helix domain-containing protein [Acidimicrobiaceae bacterium]MYA73733.1 helix-turn-helix domain-containing protein [Acidimicrobiaceae bacterium]MYD07309.1 helix-turn-helix domain-containing protein [Acidimicrobiaceae bacterium]MYG56922.1 helix-turn-helix domain-containing protein [Acidimicrobiaceae bacterium]
MDFAHPVTAVIPGAQGRVLAVLAETTAELNLRTVARLAGVSAAQASRVIPGLVDLGLVERREVPPSSLFRLNRLNAAAQTVVELARLSDTVLAQIGLAAKELRCPPASVVVFGSLARKEADRESDIDIVIVRPDDVNEDDEDWTEGVEQWRRTVSSITGNTVEVIEINVKNVIEKLASDEQLWEEVARDGVAVHGTPLNELHILSHA